MNTIIRSEAILDEIAEMFATRGHGRYGEGVSQYEHALQAAKLAEESGCGSAMIAAALLHDIGHMVQGETDSAARRGIDKRHEVVGADWLKHAFGPEVCEPVRLHVDAKRYLCTTKRGYFEQLSDGSRRSLELQGGMMTDEEVDAFEAEDYSAEAVRLRLWDDDAKVIGIDLPPFAHFRPYLEAVAR